MQQIIEIDKRNETGGYFIYSDNQNLVIAQKDKGGSNYVRLKNREDAIKFANDINEALGVKL